MLLLVVRGLLGALKVANFTARVINKLAKVLELLRLSQHVSQALVVFFELSDLHHISAWTPSLLVQVHLLELIIFILEILLQKFDFGLASRELLIQSYRPFSILLIGELQSFDTFFLEA